MQLLMFLIGNKSMNILFEECKMALSEDFRILTKEEGRIVVDTLLNRYPFFSYGLNYGSARIDWDSDKITIINYIDIFVDTKKDYLSSDVYVIPEEASLPIFKTNIFLAINNIEYILTLSLKVFLLNYKYVGASCNNEELGIRFGKLSENN